MNQALINGKPYSFQKGKTILFLIRQTGIELPALCHVEQLPSPSVCRLCLVQVKGFEQFLPSCRTLLKDGMEIETHSDEVEHYRKRIFQMLAGDYPLEAITRFPQKEFHRWLQHYGITDGLNTGTASGVDTSHPYLQIEMTRCINCLKCVKVCDEVQGQFVWHVVNRGENVKIVHDSQNSFRQSSCVSCGACAAVCPTGAIEDKQAITWGMPDMSVRSVCAYCGVGCELEIGVKNNRISGIQPAKDALVNKGHLCVKGRYAWEYVYAGDRITQPMIRRQGNWQTVSWQEVISYCAEKLSAILKLYGPDSIGVIGSARATNEENYLLQKFARTVIGTNNIDNCARVCHQPTAKAMSVALGTGASTNSFDDIEIAKTILVAGANVTGSHPVIGARIKQAAIKGTNLIVIDPRKTELAEFATCHLQIRPGTNIPLFNAMAYVIIEEDLIDNGFIQNRTEGWDTFDDFIREWTPGRAAKICQVQPEVIREAARLYARQPPSICFHGLGLTEHTQGTENVMALVNLALLTGNIGKTGAGINPLRGQNNVQGAAAMGCDPSVYTGMAPVKKEKERFEALWKTTLPLTKGLDLTEMLDAACAGHLKAIWITGYDVYFTMPDATHTGQAFDHMDLVIVEDMFMNETSKKFADVFLPCASSFEKDGTFMNAERRIQRVRKAVPAPLGVKADWEIACDMAATMGKGDLFNYSSPQEIWNEIRSAWKAVYGITYERLEQEGIQWPCPATDHPGTMILHSENFPRENGKAKLSVVDFLPTVEKATTEYPLILITGRELYHFNAGTMTYRTANKDIHFADLLHMSPEDAEAMGLQDCENVSVSSKYGETRMRVKIDDTVMKGIVFSTFSSDEVFINKITSPLRDKYVHTPEYKVTAIRIGKLSENGRLSNQ